MMTLEGIRAAERLKGLVAEHKRELGHLAANPLYAPEAVRKEQAKLRETFVVGFGKTLDIALKELAKLKREAQLPLRLRRLGDELSERPSDTPAERHLKAIKRLERELVKSRAREELSLLVSIDPARVASAYGAVVEGLRRQPGSLELTSKVEEIEATAPVLLERASREGELVARSAARTASARIESLRLEDLKRLRPEHARRLDACKKDVSEVLLLVRGEMAALGELKRANEIVSRALMDFGAESDAVTQTDEAEPGEE